MAIALLLATWALVRAAAPGYARARVASVLARCGFPEASFEVTAVSPGGIELRALDLGPGSGVTIERARLSFDLVDLVWRRRLETIAVVGAELRPRELAAHLGEARPRPQRSSPRSRLPFDRATLRDSRVVVRGRALPVEGELSARGQGAELALSSRAGGFAADVRGSLRRGGGGWIAEATAAARASGDRLDAELHYEDGVLRARASAAAARAELELDGRPATLRDVRAEVDLELAGGRIERAELEARAASAERAGVAIAGLRIDAAASGTASAGAFDLELDADVRARRVRSPRGRASDLRARGSGRARGGAGGIDAASGRVALSARQLERGDLRLRQVRVSLPYELGARSLAGSAEAAGLWWQGRRVGSAGGTWRWARGQLALDLRGQLAGDTFGRAQARLRVGRGGAVRVEKAELEAFGGRLRARPFSIRPGRERATVALAAAGLDLGRLVPLVSRGRADGHGNVGGEVIATLSWKRRPALSIERAHLRASGDGGIVIRDRQAIARLVAAAGRQPLRGLGERMVAALADFEFSELALDLPPTQTEPSRLLRLHLRGRGRRVPQEIDLTVNLRGLGRVAERALDLWLAAKPLTHLGAST